MKKEKTTGNHALSPEKEAEFQRIAKGLPRFIKYKNGKMLTRKLDDIISEPVFVDHFENLCNDYKTHGQEGVDRYLKVCDEMYQEQLMQAEKNKATIPRKRPN